MRERSLLIALGVSLVLLAWVRSNLESVFRKNVPTDTVLESIGIIARNGGTLDGNTLPISTVGSFSAVIHSGIASDVRENTASFSRTDGHDEHVQDSLRFAHDRDEHEDHKHSSNEPALSSGLILILHNLGSGELAANLLWIQMDVDSHAGFWHRVNFYLELIPALDPHFVEAFLLRANTLDRAFNKTDEAVRLLEKAVRNNPLRHELYVQIGIYAFNFHGVHGPKRDLPKALEAFGNALRIPQCPGHVARFYAFTLAAMDRGDEAERFLQALEKIPDRDSSDLLSDQRAISRIRSGEKF